MIEAPPVPSVIPRVVGARAIYYWARMLLDPIGCLRQLSHRHGRLVFLGDLLPFVQLDKPTYLVVGQPYNADVLGNHTVWRANRWSMHGPRNSAQYRLGFGLTSINGRRHAHYRQILVRPLRRSSVEAMGEDIGGLVEEQVATWPIGEPTDLWEHIKQLMRTVSINLLFGGDLERGMPLAKMIDEYMELHSNPGVACQVDIPGTPFARLLRHAEAMERCALDFAAPKRGVSNDRDLLGLIVNSPDERGKPPADALIVGHIPILFGAAYETCQTALAWALFLVAQHPQIARDLTDEVTAALTSGPPTLARIGGLRLLDAVLNESMRLLPTVPYQMRVSLTATELGGHPVAERTRAIVSSYLTNRVPEIYSEPDRFIPGRWEHIRPSQYEYMVFSAGPRLCPGLWFGTGVVKTAIAAILSRFRIAIAPGARIDRRVAVTMAPRYGMPVQLHKRDQAWATAPITGDILDMVDLPPVGGSSAQVAAAA